MYLGAAGIKTSTKLRNSYVIRLFIDTRLFLMRSSISHIRVCTQWRITTIIKTSRYDV